jgi:hypothetical protein
MNLEPPSPRPREISVTEPLSAACGRTKRMLFTPFDLSKWFVIGFCAWLANLGESGGGGGSGFNHSVNKNFGLKNNDPAPQFHHWYGMARDYVIVNMAWLLPVVIISFLIILGLGLLILWLNCRGKFMFLHCVALNRAEIVVPWDQYGGAANRLFWFRLVLSLIGMVVMLPVVVILGILIFRIMTGDETNVPLFFAVGGVGMGLLLLVVVFALIHKFMVDFVVPIMYVRGGSCLAAWREFFHLLAGHPGSFILYILIQIVLAFVLGMLVMIIFLLTCCVACCVAMLPYVGTVLLLPIFVFKRAYALYFLAQFGPSYDVFPPDAPPVATVPPPGLQPL